MVFTTMPDRDAAEKAARVLVDDGVAACVNILAACRSIYRWKGAVESAEEVPMMIKTRESQYPRLEQALRRIHPYEVPELIALPVTAGLPAYLDWVRTATSST